MKKVKVMLAAIGVLAVVGGALAFKAKTFGQGVVFCEKQGTICSDRIDYRPTNHQTNFVTTPCGDGNEVYTIDAVDGCTTASTTKFTTTNF